MRSFIALAAFAGLALAQDTTPAAGPPMGVYKTAKNAPAVTATTLTEVVAEVTAVIGNINKRDATVPTGPPMVAATDAPSRIKRDTLAKRDEVCVAQPTGIGYVTSPDDPNSFTADKHYSDAADNAVTPDGYTQVFQDIVAANSADDYMGFTFLNSYDVGACSAQCTSIAGCVSFNIYFERDPVMSPDHTSCPNPPSLTRIKCVWWGGLVSLNNANNYGNMQADFYVVVAGSNGYEHTARAAALRSATPTVAGATIATETAKSGKPWIIYYSADTSQGAYSNAGASNSYADCEDACEARTDGCKAFTYVGGANGVGSGTCWLKTELGKPNLSGKNVVSGVKAVQQAAAPAASSSTTTTTVAATSAAATSAAPSPTSSSSVAPVVVAAPASSTTTTTAVSLYRPDYGQSTTAIQYISTVSYSAPPTSSGVTTTPPASTTPKTTTTTTTTTSVSPTARYNNNMDCGSMNNVASTYSDGTNAYVLKCSYDFTGANRGAGDIGNAPSVSFYGCFAQCQQFNGCQAFTYWNGVCWYKNLASVTVQPSLAPGFDFAYIARYYTNTVAVAPSTTTTTTSTTTTTTSTTTTTPKPTTTPATTAAATTAAPTTTGFSAPGIKYASNANCDTMLQSGTTYTDDATQYTLRCNSDFKGVNDIGSAKSTSFIGCFSLCTKFSGCQAFAYATDGLCYFKKLTAGNTEPTYASTVDVAIISTFLATVTVPAQTTFATSTKASTTTSAAATTAAAVSTTNFVVQVGTSPSTSNQYLYVNWLALGRVTFVSSKSAATVFSIDKNGYIRNQSWIWLLNNYIGLTDRLGGAWQRVGFRPLGVDPLKCWLQDGYVQCNNSAGFTFAGTCSSDPGYLYFGSPQQIPKGCSWAGLYPSRA